MSSSVLSPERCAGAVIASLPPPSDDDHLNISTSTSSASANHIASILTWGGYTTLDEASMKFMGQPKIMDRMLRCDISSLSLDGMGDEDDIVRASKEVRKNKTGAATAVRVAAAAKRMIDEGVSELTEIFSKVILHIDTY